MFDFQQKRKMRTIFTSPITQGVLLFFSVLIFFQVFERYQVARDMAERRLSIEQEIAVLEERRDSLETNVKYISSPRGMEAEMRRQFDIARDGEQVVIILDEEKPATTGFPENEEKEVSRPWYKFW